MKYSLVYFFIYQSIVLMIVSVVIFTRGLIRFTLSVCGF